LRHQGDADYFAFEGLVVIYLSYGRNLLGFFRISIMQEEGGCCQGRPGNRCESGKQTPSEVGRVGVELRLKGEPKKELGIFI
jgi:hypothetical protein